MASEESARSINEQLRLEQLRVELDGIRNPRRTLDAPATEDYLDNRRCSHSTCIRTTGYRHLRIDPLGSRGAPLDIWQLRGVVVLQTGCFTGSLEQFEVEVEKQHGDNIYGEEYTAALVVIRAWLALGEPREGPVVEEASDLSDYEY